MKLFNLIFTLFLLFSCNSENENDDKMRKVVEDYFSTIKENKIEEIPSLFYENDIFSGAIKADAFFISKHYQELKIDALVKQIKIKDTTSIIPSQKQKYVEFLIKKDDDHLPIIMTFIFDEMYGFNKIASPNVLQNQMYWNKSLDSLRKKGVFPRPRY